MSRHQEYPQPTALLAGSPVTQLFEPPFNSKGGVANIVIVPGTGSASVQLGGTNDGTNYTNIGTAITSTTRDIALVTTANPLGIWRTIRSVSTITGDASATTTFYSR